MHSDAMNLPVDMRSEALSMCTTRQRDQEDEVAADD
jgi:hypothetical protein